jgi:hypothetical protein
MTFQAYLDAVKAKTGKTPADFAPLAKKKGLIKTGEIVAWLKAEYGLGHGHANAVAHVLTSAGQPAVSSDEALDKHFTGKKAVWRKPYDSLITKVNRLGSDVTVGIGKNYLSLLRGGKKFGIVVIATAERLDVGVKLKGVPPAGRLAAAGDWNTMVTHRVQISDPKEINAELLAWLKQAYQAA